MADSNKVNKGTAGKRSFDFMIEPVPSAPITQKAADRLYDPRLLVRKDSMAPWKLHHFSVSPDCRRLVEDEFRRANGFAYAPSRTGPPSPGQVVSLGGIVSKAIDLKASTCQLPSGRATAAKVRLSANLAPALARRLGAAAERLGCSKDEALEAAIMCFLPYRAKKNRE